jgi:hypothetical protein
VKIILVHCSYQQPGGEDVVFNQERQLLERAGHEVILYRRSNFEVDAYPGVKRLVLLDRSGPCPQHLDHDLSFDLLSLP